ncbi:MAG: hypothetical protein JO253_04375, partial [Alphaproteobacteria bacterium]|nr:hypothetical protein [Alphaproteobacteria bacterium]
RTRQESWRVGSLWQASNATTVTLGTPLTRDQVRSIDFHTDYDVADEAGGHNLLHAAFAQGLPIFEATTYNDPLKSRAYGDSTYSILKIDVARVQPLVMFTPSLDQFSFYLAGSSQIDIAHPLLSATQCSYGGSVYGRGYDSGALSGDHCAMGLVELRRDISDNTGVWQPYASYDIGGTWQKGPLTENEPRFLGAESVAMGVRMLYANQVNSDLQLAIPLRGSPSEMGLGHPRLFYTLEFQF